MRQPALNKTVTWLQLIVSLITIAAVLGGAAYGLVARVDKLEGWTIEHDKQIDATIARVVNCEAGGEERNVKLARIEVDVRWIRQALERRK